MVTHCRPAVLKFCSDRVLARTRPYSVYCVYSHVVSVEDPALEVGRVSLLDDLLGRQVGAELWQVVTSLASSLVNSLANHQNQQTQLVRHGQTEDEMVWCEEV